MLKERFSEVEIVELPPLRVASFRAVSRTPEDDAMKVLTQWTAEAGLPDRPRNFGFDVEVTPEQAEAGLRGYELWLVVPGGVWPTPPVTIKEFLGGRFAAMTVYNPFADPFVHIPAGWDALHMWVLAHGGDMPGEAQCLEELIERDGALHLVLYHPIPEA